MKEKIISNFVELHNALKEYRKNQIWVFRGQRDDPKWKLKPKAGRDRIKIPDQNLFRAWKRMAAAYENRIFKSDWDWLTIAQHYGLPTRLLDWTLNPLAATYFAVNHSLESQNDGVIYAYYDERAEDAGLAGEPKQKGQPEQKEPFDLEEGIKKVRPRSVTQRLVMQSGIFTIHNPPDKCLEDSLNKNSKIKLEKIIIKRNYFEALLIDLSYYGINESTLFPDFDGLSGYMTWWYSLDDTK